MLKFILGKKIGMTRIIKNDGKVIPVTIVQAEPCYITQKKNIQKDGYNALQIGFFECKKVNKCIAGHLDKVKKDLKLKYLKEFRVTEKELDQLPESAILDINNFQKGDIVEIKGVSKGKGFSGTVKRHNFSTGPKTHGSDNYRQPGSIGAQQPQRVIKGKRMSGHMGVEKITIKRTEVIDTFPSKNTMLIKGPVPGSKNSLLSIKAL